MENRYDDQIDERLISSKRDYTKLKKFQEEIKNSFTVLDEIEWTLMNIDNCLSTVEESRILQLKLLSKSVLIKTSISSLGYLNLLALPQTFVKRF